MYPGPISRWRLPVPPEARIYEIHTQADWARLVTAYPRHPARSHSSWELPGVNQHVAVIRELMQASSGRAARTDVVVVMPDRWRVAADYDAVHLGRIGVLASEGHVAAVPELGPSAVTMLRYWSSERTLWLRGVFGDPLLLTASVLSGRINGDRGIDDTTDERRRDDDRVVLNAVLGRARHRRRVRAHGARRAAGWSRAQRRHVLGAIAERFEEQLRRLVLPFGVDVPWHARAPRPRRRPALVRLRRRRSDARRRLE